MIKTALVGFGGAASNIHLPLLKNQPEIQLVAVLSSKPEQVAKLAGDVPCFSNYGDLLAKTEAQLLIITTPNHLHYEMTADALKSGKHVVIEKPMCSQPGEVESLRDLAKQQNLQLFPFHNRRWDGDFMTIQESLQKGLLGDIKVFESRFDRFRPEVSSKWKEQDGQQTGLWFDIGPHLLDQAFELFGTPLAVTARLLTTRPGAGVTDYFNVQLHYQEHEVVLGASNHCAGPVRRFYMEGSNGSVNLMGVDPQEEQQKQGVSCDAMEYGISDDFPHGHFYNASGTQTIVKNKGNWPGFYQAVTDCLLREKSFPVTVDAAYQVAKFLQLAVLSQEQNKTIWVRQYRN